MCSSVVTAQGQVVSEDLMPFRCALSNAIVVSCKVGEQACSASRRLE